MVLIFDLETKWLFQEKGSKDPKLLELGIGGIKEKDSYEYYFEDQAEKLIDRLLKADLIVTHNGINFDYVVLQPYVDFDIVKKLKPKSFDIQAEIIRITEGSIGWPKLDELAQLNCSICKNEDTLKIPAMIRNKQFNEVKRYLKNDLDMTQAVFNKIKTEKQLICPIKDYGVIKGQTIVRFP